MIRETGVQSQFESYQKTQRMVHDAALPYIQYYKVRIKGKVEQSRERNSALLFIIEKEAFGSPSTKVANFTYLQLVWFQSFPSPRPEAKKIQSDILITNRWKGEKRWTHAFPKGISAKGNTNSLIQDLNLGQRFNSSIDNRYTKCASLILDEKSSTMNYLKRHWDHKF